MAIVTALGVVPPLGVPVAVRPSTKVAATVTRVYPPSVRVEHGEAGKLYGIYAARDLDGSLRLYHPAYLGSSTVVTAQGQRVVRWIGYVPYGTKRHGTAAADFTPMPQLDFEENWATELFDDRAQQYGPMLGGLSADRFLAGGSSADSSGGCTSVTPLHRLPEVLDATRAAARDARVGHDPEHAKEAAFLVLEQQGRVRILRVGYTNEYRGVSTAVYYPENARVLALFHTHPDRSDPAPDGADLEQAEGIKNGERVRGFVYPVYVVSQLGLRAYYPLDVCCPGEGVNVTFETTRYWLQ